MNTRNKIVRQEDVASFLNGAPAILVIGSFDPLLAAHSTRLSEVVAKGEPRLVAAVTDPLDTVLSLTARLEMVAAVGVVDFVMPYAPGLETAYAWTAIHNDTALHDRWSSEFKTHVRRRSQPASA